MVREYALYKIFSFSETSFFNARVKEAVVTTVMYDFFSCGLVFESDMKSLPSIFPDNLKTLVELKQKFELETISSPEKKTRLKQVLIKL